MLNNKVIPIIVELRQIQPTMKQAVNFIEQTTLSKEEKIDLFFGGYFSTLSEVMQEDKTKEILRTNVLGITNYLQDAKDFIIKDMLKIHKLFMLNTTEYKARPVWKSLDKFDRKTFVDQYMDTLFDLSYKSNNSSLEMVRKYYVVQELMRHEDWYDFKVKISNDFDKEFGT